MLASAVLTIVLLAVVVGTPMQINWLSGEVAASSELDAAMITAVSEGWCPQVSAMRKPDQSTA